MTVCRPRAGSLVAIAAALVLAGSHVLTAQSAAQAKIDITGAWIFTVETDQGGGTPAITFKQEGEKITGNYSGLFGEQPLTGTLKGQALVFTFGSADVGEITYTGTVENNNSMKGKVDIPGIAGTFTAKRKE
jgi:hypothetical protein